ncbi:putative spermidine/putrescine-binding protein precursor [Candidatus Protochlamydia naegleriophila]|uniref:Putative spermidine/putrescine-binding protein n=1 Tax=Candidatus Protochlamydia naegleriophila TaxID=389348 RepID=A0A0U5JC44_9BACT|nr:spermidine/putrescine ABC transporter substrate-binding protein [Candidatus Protochlamydia naegleriophila]CUI16685.1 putative spermidine/putrescine-binding protein precursor [Candidatus Protochlamydia naegleriophila]
MKKYFLSLLTMVFCLAAFTGCQNSTGPELHIMIWSDYIKPELIERFQDEHQCKVVVDTFDSNESMYAKLKLGRTGYDVIFPSNYFVNIMNQQGMLQPLDATLIPNAQNLDPQYLKQINPALLNYGIPYMVSSAGIIYRTDKVADLESSWGVFGKSNYKGRMTMLNDVRETIGAALKFLGYSANTTNPTEIDEAAQLLINWKPNFAKFESEQYKAGIASAEYLIVNGYNGDALQVMKENSNVDFIYPQEGITFSVDFMVIPKDAPNRELAHAFMNYLLQADVAAENMEHSLFFSPNKAAYEKLPDDLRNNKVLFLPADVFEQAELIDYLGEKGILYNKAWDKIKVS